jgi:hypothetical protein
MRMLFCFARLETRASILDLAVPALCRRILGTGVEFAALFDQFVAAIFRVLE